MRDWQTGCMMMHAAKARKYFLTKQKRKQKQKQKRKQKHNRGNLREGREAPPRRLLHPLHFCFRFNLRRNLCFLLFLGLPDFQEPC